MLRPRAISAGLTDTGAVVSLAGWDSLFHIRLAPHLQRPLRGNLWTLCSVAHLTENAQSIQRRFALALQLRREAGAPAGLRCHYIRERTTSLTKEMDEVAS